MKLPALPKWEWVGIGLLFLFGTFLRFYHLPQTLLFLGDQGRDAIIAKQILKDRDIALIGPVTSVGNMYLGPFYYYFMVPFLALTYPDPVGPALGVALINSLSIVVLFFIGKQLFNARVAFLAAGIYSFMPLAIQYSRFSWNPNLGAPVAMILFWLLVRWIQTTHWKYALGLGLSLGIIAQLHYVALITWGLVGISWLVLVITHTLNRKVVLFQGVVIAALALLLLSPLAVFDFRHDHMISQKFLEFFTSKDAYMQPWARASLIIRETEGRMYQVLSQLVSGSKNPLIDRSVGYASMLVFLVLLTIKSKKQSVPQRDQIATRILFAWLALTIFGVSFYSSSIFYHYLTFCIPLVALYWGLLLQLLWERGIAGKTLAELMGVTILLVCLYGIKAIPYNGVGTTRIQQTAQAVLPYVRQPYNLALIAENGDFQGMNYRYFFTVSEKPPEKTDMYENLKQLIVIDEVSIGDPLSVGAFEIQAPHLSTLTTSLTINDGPRVYIYQ